MASTRPIVFAVVAVAAQLAACGPTDRERAGPSAAAIAPTGDGSTATPAEETASAAAEGSDASGEGRPLLLVFTGDFCPPCRIMKPWIDEVSREQPGIAVARVNVDRKDNERFVTFFQVESVPTLVFASPSGEIEARRVGLMKKDDLVQSLRELGWTD